LYINAKNKRLQSQIHGNSYKEDCSETDFDSEAKHGKLSQEIIEDNAV